MTDRRLALFREGPRVTVDLEATYTARRDVAAFIDTGAAVTFLDERVARVLALVDESYSVQIATASGEFEAWPLHPFFVVVGGERVLVALGRTVPAGTFETPLVLGRDVLADCTFRYDGRRGELELVPAKDLGRAVVTLRGRSQPEVGRHWKNTGSGAVAASPPGTGFPAAQ